MVFLFLLGVILIFITSKIVIDIRKIEVESIKKTNGIKIMPSSQNAHLYNDYNIKIKLQIFDVIPVLWITIDKNKIGKLRYSKRFKNLNLKNVKFNKIKKYISFKTLKKIKEMIIIYIKSFNLNLKIGTESISLTTLLIPVASAILSIILTSKTVKISNQYFQIQPVYNKRK